MAWPGPEYPQARGEGSVTAAESFIRLLDNLSTHSRYSSNSRDKAYTYSYRTIRLVVGFLGIALPLVLIIAEAVFIKGGVHVRGSLSAYYHSPVQDIFVGGLCVIGIMLATYMGGEPRS